MKIVKKTPGAQADLCKENVSCSSPPLLLLSVPSPIHFVQAQNKVLHYSISVSHQQLVCTTHFTDMGGDALNSLKFIFAFQNAFFTLT